MLVDAGTDSTSLAFMAIALVSAVGVLLWRRWSWLGIAAFVVSAPQLAVWLEREYQDSLGLTLGVLAGFWLLYVVAAIGYELREPTEDLRIVSASLLLANAALVAGAGWAMLDDTGHSDAATVWVIGAAAVHIGGAIPAYGGRMSKEIAALIMAVGTALAALGLALAIDGPALVAAWSAEALVLAWAARRFGDPRGQIAAAAFFALALAHTVDDRGPARRTALRARGLRQRGDRGRDRRRHGGRAQPPLGRCPSCERRTWASRRPRRCISPHSRSSRRSRGTSSSPARRRRCCSPRSGRSRA